MTELSAVMNIRRCAPISGKALRSQDFELSGSMVAFGAPKRAATATGTKSERSPCAPSGRGVAGWIVGAVIGRRRSSDDPPDGQGRRAKRGAPRLPRPKAGAPQMPGR